VGRERGRTHCTFFRNNMQCRIKSESKSVCELLSVICWPYGRRVGRGLRFSRNRRIVDHLPPEIDVPKALEEVSLMHAFDVLP
jgi:hypothetical protein